MPEPTLFKLGTPTQDISKGRFNSQSAKAWERLKTREFPLRVRIRDFIVASGPQGVTSAKISECFSLPLHKFSGRISQLKADGLVFDSGRTDNNFTILVGRKEWVNGSAQ